MNLSEDLENIYQQLKTISTEKSIFLKYIEDWRIESHEIIDEYCCIKSQEFQMQVKSQIDYIEELLKSTNTTDKNCNENLIEFIKSNINQLNNRPCKFSRLKIDKSTIEIPIPVEHIEISLNGASLVDGNDRKNSFDLTHQSPDEKETCSYQISLTPFNSFFPYLIETKDCLSIISDDWHGIATNTFNLLVVSKTKFHLVNKNLKILKEKLIQQQGIKDICWSNKLDRYLFLTPKTLYTLDKNSLTSDRYEIYYKANKPWERLTCNEIYLFLSTFGQNPSIVQLNFNPTVQFKKKYQSELQLKHNEIINDIKSNELHMGIVIENPLNNRTRFQIYSINNFDCVSSVELGQGWAYRSTDFYQKYWIISDCYNQRILFILNDGTIIKIESYFTKPLNILAWDKSQVVIRTKKNINVHQCQ